MKKPGLILIGAGGHAHVCIDVIEQHGQYEIVGLVDQLAEMDKVHLGYTVIATDDELPTLIKNFKHALITVGQIKTPDTRLRLYKQASENGFQFPVIVAPTATVSRYAKIGAGTIIMPGAVVNAGAKVGENCIINSCALIEHDADIGSHCHVSTGAIVNGGVTIGEGSFIGSGALIREGVSIGERCVIRMGTCVRKTHK